MHTTTPSGVSTQRGSFGEVACDSGDCLPRLACTMLLLETEKSEIGDFVWGELLVLSAGGATVGDYTYPCAGRHSSVRRTGISQGSGWDDISSFAAPRGVEDREVHTGRSGVAAYRGGGTGYGS